MTLFNVVISVLSMFIMLLKSIMFVLNTWIPVVSVAVHAVLIALYAVGVRNQAASDMSNPAQPSPGLPWYLSKGCSFASPKNHGYCMQARASFALTIVTMYVLLGTSWPKGRADFHCQGTFRSILRLLDHLLHSYESREVRT